jgi:hypothetical protein
LDACSRRSQGLEEWRENEREIGRLLAELLNSNGRIARASYVKHARGFGGLGLFHANRVGVNLEWVLVWSQCPGGSVPGAGDLEAWLFDSRGVLTDEIQCVINCRYGWLRLEPLAAPAEDGAEYVVRFQSREESSGWHNQHTIVHAGKRRRYYEVEQDRPSIWDEKGLCRFAVRQGSIVVLFPEMD